MATKEIHSAERNWLVFLHCFGASVSSALAFKVAKQLIKACSFLLTHVVVIISTAAFVVLSLIFKTLSLTLSLSISSNRQTCLFGFAIS